MSHPTKILILEYDPINIFLLENELAQAYKDYTTQVVQTEKEFEKALRDFAPDIILSDYSHPVFDWNAAFQLKQKVTPRIPFIVVAGTMPGEDAVELIKNGVTDCVFKDKPVSLVPKIRRALSEAEKSYQQSSERETLQTGIANLRAIFENTEVGFLFLDTEYKVVAYNHISSHWAANVFGIELKENINFKKVLLPERLAEFEVFGTSVMDGKAITYEATYPKTDGTEMSLVVNGKPIVSDEKTIGICIAITDITARKKEEGKIRKLNEELEERVKIRTIELTEANTALEAFSYSVSHDLLAPVRSLTGFSEIINTEHGHELTPEVKKMFNHIESSGNRLKSIIDSLLVLAKSGKKKLKLKTVDTTALFKQVWANLPSSFPNTATLELSPMPAVAADSAMLQLVITNMLSNAVKYSAKQKKPCIKVGHEEDTESTTFYVQDNGVGFDMKHCDRLFGAFQRLHGNNEFEGTGIGLTIVKQIIEKHGGHVWAEGKVNEGATFYFSLPHRAMDPAFPQAA